MTQHGMHLKIKFRKNKHYGFDWNCVDNKHRGYKIIISICSELTQIYTNRYKVPKSMSRGLLLFVSSYDAGNGNKLMLLARHLTHQEPLIESQRAVELYALDQHLQNVFIKNTWFDSCSQYSLWNYSYPSFFIILKTQTGLFAWYLRELHPGAGLAPYIWFTWVPDSLYEMFPFDPAAPLLPLILRSWAGIVTPCGGPYELSASGGMVH